MIRLTHIAALMLFAWMPSACCMAAADDIAGHLKTLRAVGPKGAGNVEAAKAWAALSKEPATSLPEILVGMDGAGRLAQNWIRSAADTIAERQLAAKGELPVEQLEALSLDRSHSPRARRIAFEWLTRVDNTTPQRLLPKMLNDPSLELRRDAVARVIAESEKLSKTSPTGKATEASYRKALAAARDADQVKSCVEALRKMNRKVDLPTHYGFLTHWKLIGPFDNRGKKGFDVAYAPEKKIDLTTSHKGKKGDVRWSKTATGDDYAMVDLNKVIGKHMGAIVYATTEFDSEQGGEVDVRLGCINGNKVWVNGQLLTANEVYHANTSIDQYRATTTLKPGKNIVLVKVCQNEQTESWAQRWQFQLRICDEIGTAVLSTDRPPTPKKTPKKPPAKEKQKK